MTDRTDTERLDALEQMLSDGWGVFVGRAAALRPPHPFQPIITGPTLREAIDAAMEDAEP